MDSGFADAIRRMVGEQGKEVLVNGKVKAFLSDYCAGQFKKEEKIFRQILEAGCGEHINGADNVLERKQKLMEQLEDDNGLSPKVTANYLDLLGLILKGDTSKCGGAVAPSAQTQPSVPQSAPLPAQTQPSSASQSAVPDGFVWIPGGTFMMGSPKNEPGHRNDENPQHQVTLSGFYMGKYQVTQKEYQAVMGHNPSIFKGDNLPVETVSWYDAIEYCNKLSLKEGLTPAYTGSGDNITWNRNANGYRLPTGAEWEYACRAGTTTAYNTGKSIIDNTGWYYANSGGETHPVGQKPANAWGLYDMHGNVFEWCWDWYGDYSSGPQTDPVGAVTGAYRVGRGGHWGHYGQGLRSAYRYFHDPGYRGNIIGFRLVRS